MPRNIVISEDEFQTHRDKYDGLCLECEQWTYGEVEPDAHRYECSHCGSMQCYGTEELLIMGFIEIGD